MYKIAYSNQAVKVLQKMPLETARLLRKKIEQVAVDPFRRIPNAKRLQNRPGNRLRVGDWRIIYEIEKERVLIIVVKIAQRGEVYR